MLICGILETSFLGLGVFVMFVFVLRISNQLFTNTLRRETKQILFYLSIFGTCAFLFLVVQGVLFLFYPKLKKQLPIVFLFTYVAMDFPVIGYLIAIHHQNFREQHIDDGQSTTDMEVESYEELDNEDIFNAIFL